MIGPGFAQETGRQFVRLLLFVVVGVLIIGVLIGFTVTRAFARDNGQWADAAPHRRDWFSKAEVTKAAQPRIGFKSCCEKADVVKTTFRVDKTTGSDTWFYDNHGTWTRIPDDIIHWGESGPDGEAVLFKVAGREVCFWPPDGGI